MEVQDKIRIVQKIIMFLVIILTVFFITKHYFIQNEKTKYNKLLNINKAMNSSIAKYKDAYNREHTMVEVMVTTAQDVVLKLQSKDSTIIALQQLLTNETKKNRKVEAAMVLYNTTINHLKDSLTNIISGYSTKDSIKYPIYSREYQDTGNWIKGKVVLGLTKFELTQHIRNKYDFTLGKEVVKKGFLGIGRTYKTYAEITNYNPYTETQDMKVYQKVEEPTHATRNNILSIGTGILIGILIHLL